MSDITEKIAALEAAAKEATPGPWDWGGYPCTDHETAVSIFKESVDLTVIPNENGYFCSVFLDDGLVTAVTGHGPNGQRNAEFIALANPATVSELIAHIRQQEAELATLRGEVARREALDHESKRAIDKHNQQLAIENAALRDANATLRDQIKRAEEQEPVAWVTEDGERAVTDKTYRAALRDGGASKSAMAPFCVPAYRLPKPAPVSVPDGVSLIPTRRYKELIDCLEAMASGSGGWAWEDVLEEHRAMLVAAHSPTEKKES